ncbi:MAG: NAD(P)/FAD-dependent oxidoreductase [Ruminococcaceae bacterium]|nr:NAD(P)/FAD-dependent oxidoreductase [Oscillospiraceae bacterium]
MGKRYDVAVIGAGVVGGMIARELSKYQLNICVLDRENDVAMGATKANSAIVHAGFDAKEGSLKANLNVRGSQMMEKVCSELGVKYQKNGSLVIGFSDEDRVNVEALVERGKKNGVEGVRLVEQQELFALEPNISKNAICALYAPTGAIVCPYELCIASIGNAMDNGADLALGFEVAEIEKANGVYVIKGASGETVEAMYVVNAAGVFSDKIAKMVGDDSFDVHARRGEYILLDRECGGIVKHTIFRTPSKMGKGILVSPTVDGNLLLGPTSVDIDDRDDKSTTPEGLARVIRECGENIEGGVPVGGKSITSFCGLRAVGSTGDFIINSSVENFVNVAGIESPGLSSAPAIAEYVRDILSGIGLELVEKKDFDPIREPKHHFREASIEEKNEIIKKDASYGRIICRCETVSEGEIIDAIRSNPPARDIDGVKRRTRSGMGRCQGGFCGPYVMELIAKERGIPFEDVTKSGGKSVMVYGKTK